MEVGRVGFGKFGRREKSDGQKKRGAVKVFKRTTLNAQVINVTNQKYVPTLSLLRNLGIAEPGRNVRLQVVYAW